MSNDVPHTPSRRTERLDIAKLDRLADSRAKVEFVLGDARLSLVHGPPRKFDLLVLDVFSSDLVPLQGRASEEREREEDLRPPPFWCRCRMHQAASIGLTARFSPMLTKNSITFQLARKFHGLLSNCAHMVIASLARSLVDQGFLQSRAGPILAILRFCGRTPGARIIG
jgi:hypothetical protein